MNQCPTCQALGYTTMCFGCQGKLYRCLQTIARLTPELHTELTKQTAKASKMARATGNSEQPLIYSPGASELTTDLAAALIKWCTFATPYVDLSTLTLTQLAAHAFYNYRRLARVYQPEIMYIELCALRDALVALADLPAERVFLGTCVACGAPIHGEAVTEYLECHCGAQMDVQAARRATRASIEDSWLTPKEIRAYLMAKKIRVTSQQLSNWGREEKVRRQDGYYLLSSVMAYAQRERPTRV